MHLSNSRYAVIKFVDFIARKQLHFQPHRISFLHLHLKLEGTMVLDCLVSGLNEKPESYI